MHAIKAGGIRGMYIMGENPAMSDPDANHAREALAALEHLVVQDIFLTETAYLADVILPASAFPEKTGTFTNTDRLVQMGRQAHRPAGRRAPGPLDHPADRAAHGPAVARRARSRDVFDEMRQTMPSIAGITWERLEREHAVTYPCTQEGDPGRAGRVRRARSRARAARRSFVPADIIPRRRAARRRVPDGADHRPPARALAHRQHDAARRACSTRSSPIRSRWSTRSTSPRSARSPGDVVTIESRRGEVALYARADDSSPRGAVFVPFCYYEAAINRLTNAALDPFGKIPEFKYCAVRLSLGGTLAAQTSFGGGQALARALTPPAREHPSAIADGEPRKL